MISVYDSELVCCSLVRCVLGAETRAHLEGALEGVSARLSEKVNLLVSLLDVTG